MQAEQAALEAKNQDLSDNLHKKSKAHQQSQKMYQSLKAQVMASHIANAACDEAEMTSQTARGDRFTDRLPGVRTSTANYSRMGVGHQQGRRQHSRVESGSSGSSNQQRGGIGLGPTYAPHLQGHGLGSRGFAGRELSFRYFLCSKE